MALIYEVDVNAAIIGNPLFLVKARMQVIIPLHQPALYVMTDIPKAYSPALPIGTQHYYKNSLNALTTIWRTEGIRGYVRGMDAAILRTAMGSSVQLPTYNWTKNQLVRRGILPGDSVWSFLASSTVSGICVVCV
jgi:solute carrier family 25 protein 34/35